MKNFFLMLFALSLYILLFGYVDDYKIFREMVGLLNQKAYIKSLVYFTGFFLSVYSLYILLNIKSKIIQLITAVIIVFTTSLTYTYGTLDNFHQFGGFRYEDALNILQLLQTFVIVDAGATYIDLFVNSLLMSLVLLTLLLIINHFLVLDKFNKRWMVVPILSFLFIYAILEKTTANRLSFTPPFKLSTLLAYSKMNELYVGVRNDVNISIEKKREIKHIVFIVDESIRADKLQLNGFKKETTPFLNGIQNKIYNYGESVSGTVCSNYSESVLLTGLTQNRLPDIDSYSRKMPTIFMYAQNAGYKSNLIDLMVNKKNNRHFLQEKDFNAIDNIIDLSVTYKNGESFTQDFNAISELNKIINDGNKTFTYLVKYGAHFPYESTYPQTDKIFSPTLNGSSWKTDDKNRFLNSYYNSIRWGVDTFFKELVKQLEGTDTLIVYTSDHGQNLMDDLTIKQTHCAKGAAPQEMARVPLFLMAMNDNVTQEVKKIYKKSNMNHTSHFNIFGTILYFMDYEKNSINKEYGKTLLDDLQNEKRVYTSGDIFGRSQMFMNNYNERNLDENN